jgi:hypothetical protein
MRTLWIDGACRQSADGRLRQIINPATLELVDEVAEATAGR